MPLLISDQYLSIDVAETDLLPTNNALLDPLKFERAHGRDRLYRSASEQKQLVAYFFASISGRWPIAVRASSGVIT